MKNILITGAGGTVGLSLTALLTFKGYRICGVDRSEDAVSKLVEAKQGMRDNSLLCIEFGDILNKAYLDGIVRKYEIDTIIHCAALKHVSTGYYYPEKLAFENTIAFSNIMHVVRDNESVKKVVLCSTDKAAQSASVMGASKRFLEVLGENANIPHAEFVSIRFGNILHSNGSITRVVERRIAENRPVVIRDDSMTRYILTIEDVKSLAIFAMENGKQGDICSLRVPSVKVIDLVAAFLLKKESRTPIICGENSMNESVHESLFNSAEVEHVVEKGQFFIYNKNISGNISDADKKYLLSSGNFPVEGDFLLNIL